MFRDRRLQATCRSADREPILISFVVVERITNAPDTDAGVTRSWVIIDQIKQHIYPREEAASAIASLENRTAKGKVVLRVRD